MSLRGERRCRVCGCSEYEPCEPPCGWAGATLCTACEGRPEELYAALDKLTRAAVAVEPLRPPAFKGSAAEARANTSSRRALERALKRALKALTIPTEARR